MAYRLIRSRVSSGWPVAESPVGSPRLFERLYRGDLGCGGRVLRRENIVKQKRSVESQFRIYVGLDWGTEFPPACVLDCSGKILGPGKVDPSGQAITEFLRSLNNLAEGQPGSIAMALEVPRGPGGGSFPGGRIRSVLDPSQAAGSFPGSAHGSRSEGRQPRCLCGRRFAANRPALLSADRDGSS